MLGGLWRSGDEDDEEEVLRDEVNDENGDEEEQGGMFGGWLPEEVAVRVFRWLAPEDLARAELVCRQWHGLLSLSPASSSLTPWLWRKVAHPPPPQSCAAWADDHEAMPTEQVHERHFGGPMPTKKKKSFDQRTFCLHSARLLHKYHLRTHTRA